VSRKAADLETLLRLHSWTVDERRRELGVLLAREEQLIAEGEALQRRLLAEQRIAAEDPIQAGFAYGTFAEDYKRRREQLERILSDLREEILAARERLADAYRELKVMEEVQKERLHQEQVEEARKEQAVFDEIGQTQFRLRQPS
jgi:flagellar protein FliJ